MDHEMMGIVGEVSASFLSEPSVLTPQQKILNLAAELRPAVPLHIFNHATLRKNAREFMDLFPGRVMYAVKSNPLEAVIETLHASGIRIFDAASIDEVRLIRRLAPTAKIHFMHTVKSREAIREAYFTHQVRVFVIDHLSELHKIVHETDLANDLEIFVRVALPKNKEAAVDFSAKFGATPKESVKLLREARLVSAKIGVMFHPGTQSTNPEIYARGIATIAEIMRKSRVKIDALDVGGGFPAPYLGSDHPPLAVYMAVIAQAIKDHELQDLELYCEPGRALVGESGSLIVRVEQRRGRSLYLNDGVYGGLVEAAKWQGELRYPVTHISQDYRPQGDNVAPKTTYHGVDFAPILESPDKTSNLAPHKVPDRIPDGADDSFNEFRFCGPTCDSVDMMKGPFVLPETIREGDWIMVGLTGAYSNACRTQFNGFREFEIINVDF